MANLMKIISKTYAEMKKYIESEMHKKGHKNITISHGNILINFTDCEELNYKELSKRINKSPQTMTTLIRKLQNEGYINLRIDQNDRRNKLVFLTEKGKAFIPIMIEISENLYSIQYKNIPIEEVLETKKSLLQVLSNFEDINR